MAKLIVVFCKCGSTTAYSGEAGGSGATERWSTIFRLRKVVTIIRCSSTAIVRIA
jgi:hypothetical protein